MSQEVIELQSKLSFQEQALAELNEVLVSQQRQIDGLQLQLKILQDRLQEIEDSAPADTQDEKPPHY